MHALNRSHAVGVGWGCTIPSGASLELDHRPRAQPAPICCQESKGAAFVPRVGCSNRPGGRRRPDSSDRRIDRDQSTKASKRVGPATGFLLASARDLRFSPRAIQQGNVGLLGTRNGITRSLGRRVKTPDSSRSYADPVLKRYGSIKRWNSQGAGFETRPPFLPFWARFCRYFWLFLAISGYFWLFLGWVRPQVGRAQK